jgi:hypothetical protein
MLTESRSLATTLERVHLPEVDYRLLHGGQLTSAEARELARQQNAAARRRRELSIAAAASEKGQR